MDKTIFGLKHQIQPTTSTCVQTCIAMALGVPVNDVINRYGGESLNQQELTHILTECKVIWNQFTTGTMIYDGWYFAVVPSLNIRGGNHQILIHWKSEAGLSILDPSNKEKYKPDGSDLRSWECLTPFWPGGQLKN